MPRLIHVLDHHPELASQLNGEDLAAARRFALAVAQPMQRGPWAPERVLGSVVGGIVHEGLLVRRSTIAGATATTLLGPGDLLVAPATKTAAIVSWEVLEAGTVLWLGPTFERTAARWPALNRALLKMGQENTERAVAQQAIVHLQRTDDRVFALLCQLANRWGRVGSDGILLPMRLQHRLLAELIGARRPSVTTALGRLAADGRVIRRDGAWLLNGAGAHLDLVVCRSTAASSASQDGTRSVAMAVPGG